MFNLFTAFKKDRIWDFDGGIHPPEMKTQSSGAPLRTAPLPDTFIIPLQQHLGPEGELLVQAGDSVLKGQPLTMGRGRTLPVHAPTSGTVIAIKPHITAHPSGLAELCVIIRPDGEDRWCERQPAADFRQLAADELIQRIHQAGIAGLGGAGFPTASKLQGGAHGVETLILNAAECEPYITADDRLMRECAEEILQGTDILRHLLQPKTTLIGIEDNKPEAIAALKEALRAHPGIGLRVIPTKYPSGGAKQLTKILTGKEVPHGKHSSAIGVLMQNVGTAFAIKRAIVDGEPLIERVVTLTGEALSQPGNLWARIGTPVEHLLKFAGFRPQSQQMVVMGGPLMGFTLPALNVPIVKISNCLLAPSVDEMAPQEPEQSCIRCGLCVDACPAGLLPQQLYWFSRGQEHDKARQHNLFDCIECGACAYVCPSNIPLVQYYRQEKAEIKAIDQEAARAAEAKARYEAKQARMEREKLAREERHKKAAVKLTDNDQSAVQAALARVRSKNDAAVGEVQPGAAPDNSAAIAAREARKAQARERKAQQQVDAPAVDAAEADDPRKAAVAAALARVKAKKAAQQADDAPAEAPAAAEETDPRKAAVAAAIARAKAKKAAAQQADDAPAEAPAAAEETDPRKAAVAAAIARAKAKKAAAQQADDVPAEAPAAAEEIDPRKAAVAAAIARAKAKKAAAQQADDAPAEAPAAAEETDPRKAAVAAAIARVKAKKAAQQEDDAPAEAPAAAEETDPRKAAVAAAIARVKAKKAAAQQTDDAPAEAPAAVEETDPRKAAVAAAIARVKAKKAAAQQTDDAPAEAPAAVEETDPRKAAVAAAIARVKAKKADQQAETEK